MPDHRLVKDSVGLNVHVEGDGAPVLLLHGFPDSHALWRKVAPRLVEAGYRTIAPDLRGFGTSDAPEDVPAYRIEALADDALHVLDALGVERAAVVGHDWGAILGWRLAALHPERVSRLAAVSVGHPRAYATAGPAQIARAWYVLFFQFRLAERLIRRNDWALLRHSARGHPETECWIADLSRPGRLRAALNLYRANRSLMARRLPPAQAPVLGVWSPGDVALTEKQMTGSARFAPAGWRYERVEGAGHWIPLDAPDRLGDLLIDFLGGDRSVAAGADR